jgi:hypothetical protein
LISSENTAARGGFAGLVQVWLNVTPAATAR